MRRTLQRAHADPRFTVGIVVTGMHLEARYGTTVKEIEASGVPIAERVPVTLTGESGPEMALALADALRGFVGAIREFRPDVAIVLGDRGEMLAGALAAVHANVPVVHIHGGERSGTIDESLRHAITKLSHFHFTATEGARQRLIRMGEDESRVFCTGAPGLDGLWEDASIPRHELCARHGFAADQPVILLLYHPVVQDADQEESRMERVLAAVARTGAQVLCLMPNSDAGGAGIRRAVERWAGKVCLLTHLDRREFVAWLAAADVMVGNSSSGIIEAASFGLPVVNVGDRQNGRERNGNVNDVPATEPSIYKAVVSALRRGRTHGANIYGDGRAGERIVDLLARLPLDHTILKKLNAY